MKYSFYLLLTFFIGSFFLLDLNCGETFKVKLNEKGQFIDNYGRIRIFHGFNSVFKGFPWYDNQILNETRLKLYKEWGFNIVRLGAMWTGAEPKENNYNESYFDILKIIADKLDQFGMHTFLDMHQDVLSSRFNNYDGVPLWLIDKFPKVENLYRFPFPLNPNISYSWSTYYMTYAASNAYQNLYDKELGVPYWVRIWEKYAQTFVNTSSIIGYELINEPWFGNFYENYDRLLPGYVGKYNLLPAYDEIVKAIRKIDNDTLIFYEPVTFGAYFPSVGTLGTGFERVPGGESQRNKSVLSYHYYCFLLSNINPDQNYPKRNREICDELFAKNVFISASKNIMKTGGGSMLTEFGICIPDNNTNSINTVECNAILDLADEFHQSFTYWDSIFFDKNSKVLSMVIKSFARSYPRALQGQPIQYSFNITTAIFNLKYYININIKAPTEIFIPLNVHYSQGFENVTIPIMITEFDKENFIFFVYPPKTIEQNTSVTIIIKPIKSWIMKPI